MIVRKTEDERFEVGHYTPDGKWEVLSVGKAFEDAIRLANFINGGTGQRLWNAQAAS